MNEALENVIRKVRKLLTLADKNRNTSENEISTALQLARTLMTEHNISMSDVEIKEMKNEGATEKAAMVRRQCVPWERCLGGAVAELFDTRSYRHDDYPRGFCMRFIGVGIDAEISVAAYESLHETLKQMGKDSPHRGPDQGAFLLGIANRIRDRANLLASESRKKQKSASNSCKEMVLVKEVIIEEHAKTLGLRSIKSGSMGGSYTAHQEGYIKGGNIDLNFRQTLK